MKKTVKALMGLTLVILLAFAPYLRAEAVTDATGLEVGQTSVMYDSSIGMPTSEANAIAQTSDGFIWIGSYSGLMRYDGTTFDRYDPSTGIATVVSLFVDSKDRLWVGTNDSGVAIVRDDQITFFTRKDGLPSATIRAIEEDRDGNIIIGTTRGVVRYDGETMRPYKDERLKNAYVCEMHTDNRGIIYGETIEGDFFSLDGNGVRDFYSDDDFAFGVVNCITPDTKKEGWVYLGTEGQTIIHADMDGGMTDYQLINTPDQTHINAMQIVDDDLWICADDGIAHIDEQGKYMKLSQVDMDNSVDDMMVDYEHNLWFVSSRQGVMKITSSVFSNITRIAGVYDKVCNTTYIKDNDLYIGTDTGLIVLDENRQVKPTPLTDLLAGARVRCIYEDSKGTLWICTYSDHALVRLDPDGSIREYTTANGLPSNRARTILERKNGDLVLSASGGISILRDGEIVKQYDKNSGLANTEILTLEEDPDGNLYMGSDGDGLYVVNKKEKLKTINSENGLSSDVILRAKWDKKNNCLWMITSNSIGYLRGGQVITVRNFPYANNFDMFFDENNNMWVLSSGGVYVVNTDMMLKNQNIDYMLYDASSGLAHVTTANSFNYLNDKGDLYICGTTGVSEVNINENQNTSTDIRLTIPFVEADGDRIYFKNGDTVTIPAGTQRINIYGYALSYSLNNPWIRYSLEGFDKEPTMTTKRDLKPVTYTNLNGGSYTFTLATVNSLTGEEEAATQVMIVKEKALYENWWFTILMIFAVMAFGALVVWNFFRIRTARLERKQKETQQMRDDLINAFAKVIDMKDEYTNGHSFRVARYASMLAEKMGYTEDEINNVHNIALLHDIGKISIPDEILHKPEGLNDEEYEIMKTHAQNGFEILKDIKIAPELAIGAGYHHERPDGKGYPNGRKGEEIPLVARLIAVADTFDAMYSTRPYRKKMELSVVVERIKESAGTQLDPQVVEKFVELYEEGRLEDENVE